MKPNEQYGEVTPGLQQPEIQKDKDEGVPIDVINGALEELRRYDEERERVVDKQPTIH